MAVKTVFLFFIFVIIVNAQDINKIYPGLEKLYKELHAFPELSLKEEKTSERIAQELKNLGFAVTEKFAGYGFAAVMKNGEGKTLLIRTDMDALPVEEITSLPFISANKGVMHACGHDMHMSIFVGTARLLSENRDKWKGTLIMIGQPAEEVGKGALLMLNAGLYDKIGIPDFALAIHVVPGVEAGNVTFCPGNAMASSSSVTIKVKGIGGHGAIPQNAIDPVVLSAEMIMAFQTIESREISPFDPAVITVGYIKGGTKHNIIPNEVEMGLTVRSYNDDVHNKIIASIKNKANKIAESGGLNGNMLPEIAISDNIPSLYNNPVLTGRVVNLLKKELGEERIKQVLPMSVSEDFSYYSRTKENVPIFMLWIGLEQKITMEKISRGERTPILHAANLLPDYENTIKTGIKAIYSSSLGLLAK